MLRFLPVDKQEYVTDKLLVEPLDETHTALPSPLDLKRKIIVKVCTTCILRIENV